MWSEGPELNIGRRGHKAGLVRDHFDGQTELYVFGGFDGKKYLDSTEILRDGKWVMGKKIPGIDSEVYNRPKIFCRSRTFLTFS